MSAAGSRRIKREALFLDWSSDGECFEASNGLNKSPGVRLLQALARAGGRAPTPVACRRKRHYRSAAGERDQEDRRREEAFLFTVLGPYHTTQVPLRSRRQASQARLNRSWGPSPGVQRLEDRPYHYLQQVACWVVSLCGGRRSRRGGSRSLCRNLFRFQREQC